MTKNNSNLTFELTSLREQVKNARADAVAEFQMSVAYYNELGAEFNEGFRLIRAQASELYKESRTLVWIFFKFKLT